jgi:RHS repeat-associated protein
MTGDGTRTFAYDYQGRMKSTTSGGATTSFVYNALGQRIKRGGTVTRVFFYDQAQHLQGEYTATRALVQETVWLGDIPVATLRPKSGGGVDIFYVHTDHLNTPRKVSQPSDNKLRWRWDSTPFGTGVPNENPEGAGTFAYNLRFPGQYFDTETGLHYNYFRDYDPPTGRYVQSDPIGLEGGINTYAYVDANPLTWSDPLGLDPKGERGATGGVGGKNTNNPYKHCREFDPPERDFVRCKDHQSGKWVRKPRPAEMPFPGAKSEMCGEDCKDTAATVVVAGGTAYIVYRCVRMVPSLMPPLWPTIPANLVVP